MSTIKKHIGKIKSTDQRCVVVFMQLPDDLEKALIINTESLPDRYEQMLMEVVQSAEGQQEKDLANTMGRRMVPETGRTVLAEFHARGLMRAESVDNIIMMPRPNTPFPLRDILIQMGTLQDKAAIAAQSYDDFNGDTKFNHLQANQQATVNETAMNMARNMLMEAEMLQAEANKKFEAAYKHAPHLRPQAKKFEGEEVVYRTLQEPTRTVTETGETPVKRGRGRPSNASKAAAAAAGSTGAQ